MELTVLLFLRMVYLLATRPVPYASYACYALLLLCQQYLIDSFPFQIADI